MMFRPSHPRVMNYRPRFNPQHDNYQWRPNADPRAFVGNINHFRPRLPHISEHSNQEHWCETCDRGFPTIQHLEEHKSQHQKCNIDGCQFIAHPKVITKHIQMQHSSGVYKKIAKLDNPEAIKKWREERKKNFPTRSTIEKKTAELKEKIERGEKMCLKHGQRIKRDSNTDNKRKLEPSNKRNNDRRDFKKKKIFNENNQTDNKNKPPNPRDTLKYIPPIEDKCKLKTFSGIQKLIMDITVEEDAEESNCNLVIEDDDNEVGDNSQEKSNSSEPVLCGALVSLMSQYDSSDEEDQHASCNINESPVMIKDMNMSQNKSEHISIGIENTKKNEIISQSSITDNTIYATNDDNADSGPEEVKVVKSIEIENNESTSKETAKFAKRKQQYKKEVHINVRKPKSKLPSTLLQKLLSKEIRHERNMILQCVRYIIKNNYFDK